jgi:two-component system chemotaxis response regulator CheB
MKRSKIRVLIVDDSILFRRAIAKGIAADAMIEVVGEASDAYEARDKILNLHPDVLTLDIEMPRMNGIDFLKKLIPQYPIPTVVVSSVSDCVFDAMNAGAVDFVSKPGAKDKKDFGMFINELVVKIKIASTASVSYRKPLLSPGVRAGKKKAVLDDAIIAIGASTGGTEAIFAILKALPAEMPGIVIVQHMPPVFTAMYAERLRNGTPFDVKEAENHDVVGPGMALVAPGDFHMKLCKNRGEYFVECFKADKVNGHRPSIDVLFKSVAETAGGLSVGILLTGMGYDGAKGLLEMKNAGAMTLGQDESTCVVYGMPKVAYDIGAVKKQLPLDEIPKALIKAVDDLFPQKETTVRL